MKIKKILSAVFLGLFLGSLDGAILKVKNETKYPLNIDYKEKQFKNFKWRYKGIINPGQSKTIDTFATSIHAVKATYKQGYEIKREKDFVHKEALFTTSKNLLVARSFWKRGSKKQITFNSKDKFDKGELKAVSREYFKMYYGKA
ncbi:hypothetical protein KAW80_02110 [Candidatus Babeliales bacterium]|nr:hypothetical protein [Candidatus Babeliales bacterium]